MPYRPGDLPVPGYRLTRWMGSGQFGEVWEAMAPGRVKIALKIIDLPGQPGKLSRSNCQANPLLIRFFRRQTPNPISSPAASNAHRARFRHRRNPVSRG